MLFGAFQWQTLHPALLKYCGVGQRVCVAPASPNNDPALSLSVCFERQVEDDSRVFYLLILQHDDENTPDSKFLSNVFKPYRTKFGKNILPCAHVAQFPFQ